MAVNRTFTIAESASLSDAIILDEALLAGLLLPAAWTTADLTLQASTRAAPSTYANVYDVDGTEVTIKAAASRYVALNPADFAGMYAIKLRSGTSGSPVTQAAARSIVATVLSDD